MADDYEDDVDNGGNDDGVSLPKATVTKLINEMMPADLSCAKETRDLLIECCVEFIHLIASEANEISEANAKKTISAEHVISALEVLGFSHYLDEVKKAKDDHTNTIKARERRSSKKANSDISQEEMTRQQMQMLEESRKRYLAQAAQVNNVVQPTMPTGGAGSNNLDEDEDDGEDLD